MEEPPLYVAVGDSMSIDLYPRLDLDARGDRAATSRADIGAAALFHRNDEDLWPEFSARDLAHRHPGIGRLDLCVDGATIGHTAEQQLPRVRRDLAAAAILVTVTAGGNDLLGGLQDGIRGLERAADAAIARYHDLVDRVLATFPSAIVLLTTVYDPTDGSGLLPGVSEILGTLPMQLLDRFNAAVAKAADASPRTRLADVHGHFLGHGLSARPDDRWYWSPSPIEPGARGASEIRRVWIDALERAPRRTV